MTEFQFERIAFPNGLRLLFHRSDRVPLVSLGGFVLAGKDQNPLDRPGLASLTARLLDEGTSRHSHLEISQVLEGMGAQVSTFSERELSGVAATLQASCLEKGLELLAEMLQDPVFPDARIGLEKNNVLNHIQAMKDDPQVVGSQALNRWIYQGTSFQEPTMGTPESLGLLDRDSLCAFHRAKYGPQNTIIVGVGDVDPRRFLEVAERSFGRWKNPELSLQPLPRLVRRAEASEEKIAMPKEQLSIFLGHLGMARSNPDFYAGQVMDAILGGGPGFTSRIPKRIRDEQGLAYTTYADLCGSAGIYPGRFVAFAGTSPENGKRALTGLRSEIRKFCSRGPTRNELETAVRYLTGSFVFEFQSNTSVARMLLAIELFSLKCDFLHQYPQLIEAVTREDVHRVARDYLDTLDYATIIVGPV